MQEKAMSLPKIDVHSHIIPPLYREALVEKGHQYPDGMPGIPVCCSVYQTGKITSAYNYGSHGQFKTI
jgi:hypothetical protein